MESEKGVYSYCEERKRLSCLYGWKGMVKIMEQTQAAIVWFTENGEKLAYRIKEKLEKANQNLHIQMGRKSGQSLKEWCREGFERRQLLIFVGAVGIAVRTIAPFLKDKFTDPAVLVLDEQGRYVIPVLSGHVGGGNRWAAFLADELSAVGVITTATDLYGKFAVDVFASGQKLAITDRGMAKKISAEILAGAQVGIYCEGKVSGSLPKELIWEEAEELQRKPSGESAEELRESTEGLQESLARESAGGLQESPARENAEELRESPARENAEELRESPAREERSRIYIGIHRYKDRKNTLYLHPKALVIGIGCKKGKAGKEIEAFVQRVLQEQQLAMESVLCLASLDLKQEEKGILEFAGKYQLPFVTFSREQLLEAPGEYTESEFVKEVTGIGNVCERSAVLAAGEFSDFSLEQDKKKAAGRLILEKTAECGITLALAEKEWSVEFE